MAQYRQANIGTILENRSPCVYWGNIGYNIDPILYPMLTQYCTNVACYKGRLPILPLVKVSWMFKAFSFLGFAPDCELTVKRRGSSGQRPQGSEVLRDCINSPKPSQLSPIREPLIRAPPTVRNRIVDRLGSVADCMRSYGL